MAGPNPHSKKGRMRKSGYRPSSQEKERWEKSAKGKKVRKLQEGKRVYT